MSKKIIYLVTAASAILAAAILKQDNNETEVEASLTGKELDPMATWKKLHEHDRKEPAIPVAVHLLEKGLSDEEREEGKDLASAIEHYAFDVNNPDHLRTLERVLKNDYSDLAAKGAILNDAAGHEDNLQELYGEKKADEQNDENKI